MKQRIKSERERERSDREEKCTKRNAEQASNILEYREVLVKKER